MKHSDFKQIVKESLKEAFYTPKEKLSNEYIIGIVDYTGAVHTQKVDFFSGKDYHHLVFPHIRGDRFRIDGGEVIWTTPPSEDSIISIENFLSKKGMGSHIHRHAVNGLIFKSIDENRLLTEELFGKKMKIMFFGSETYAVLSKNTKSGERPYRISFFGGVNSPDLMAEGHIDITYEEALEILESKELTDTVYERLRIKPENLYIKKIYENLLLLEESSREIELWLDNKI